MVLPSPNSTFHIESKIFTTTITKTKTYVLYVDDIFIATHSFDEINKLKKIRTILYHRTQQ